MPTETMLRCLQGLQRAQPGHRLFSPRARAAKNLLQMHSSECRAAADIAAIPPPRSEDFQDNSQAANETDLRIHGDFWRIFRSQSWRTFHHDLAADTEAVGQQSGSSSAATEESPLKIRQLRLGHSEHSRSKRRISIPATATRIIQHQLVR